MSAKTRTRTLPLLLSIAASALVAVIVVVTGGDDGGSTEPTAEASASEKANDLTAYEAAIEPILFEGGRVVVEGLRPGILAVRDGAQPDDQLQATTQAYVGQLRQLRQQLLDIETPTSVREAVELFRQAMNGYIDAAALLHDAALARGEERQALVSQVAPRGEAADEIYDQAWEVINAAKRRLGLPVEELPQ